MPCKAISSTSPTLSENRTFLSEASKQFMQSASFRSEQTLARRSRLYVFYGADGNDSPFELIIVVFYISIIQHGNYKGLAHKNHYSSLLDMQLGFKGQNLHIYCRKYEALMRRHFVNTAALSFHSPLLTKLFHFDVLLQRNFCDEFHQIFQIMRFE